MFVLCIVFESLILLDIYILIMLVEIAGGAQRVSFVHNHTKVLTLKYSSQKGRRISFHIHKAIRTLMWYVLTEYLLSLVGHFPADCDSKKQVSK